MPGKKKGKGGKKGKKGGKKLSQAEKQKLKLEDDSEKLRATSLLYIDFCRRGDQWLLKNHPQVIELLAEIDIDGEGIVSFEEFKSAMFDLEAPFTAVELHLMCKLIGKETVIVQESQEPEAEGTQLVSQEIEYSRIKNGFAPVRADEQQSAATEVVLPVLEVAKRMSQTNHCDKCHMVLWDGEDFKAADIRYFEVSFRMITFDQYKHYPGHFTLLLPSHYIGSTIEQILKDKTHFPTKRLHLYREKPKINETRSNFESDKTLEDYYSTGGTQDSPTKITLYYDFAANFPKCPILNCDFYFSTGAHRKIPDRMSRSERVSKERSQKKHQ